MSELKINVRKPLSKQLFDVDQFYRAEHPFTITGDGRERSVVIANEQKRVIELYAKEYDKVQQKLDGKLNFHDDLKRVDAKFYSLDGLVVPKKLTKEEFNEAEQYKHIVQLYNPLYFHENKDLGKTIAKESIPSFLGGGAATFTKSPLFVGITMVASYAFSRLFHNTVGRDASFRDAKNLDLRFGELYK